VSSVRRARGQSRDDRDDHKTVAHPFPTLARTLACSRVTFNLEKNGNGTWDVFVSLSRPPSLPNGVEKFLGAVVWYGHEARLQRIASATACTISSLP
jgi:hypothetical protein